MAAITPSNPKSPTSLGSALEYFQEFANSFSRDYWAASTTWDVTANALTVTSAAAYDAMSTTARAGGYEEDPRFVFPSRTLLRAARLGRPSGLPYLTADVSVAGTVVLTLSATHTEGAF